MNSFDRIFSDAAYQLSTFDSQVNPLTEVEREIFEDELQKYYVAKTQKRIN
jgi:hypothetical protein